MLINTKLPDYINDLINARKEAKMTQFELADKVRCDRNYISKIERAKVVPSGTLLGKLCDELGLTIRLVKG